MHEMSCPTAEHDGTCAGERAARRAVLPWEVKRARIVKVVMADAYWHANEERATRLAEQILEAVGITNG